MTDTNSNVLDDYLASVHAIKSTCDLIISQHEKYSELILSAEAANEVPDNAVIEEYVRLTKIAPHAYDLLNQVSNPKSVSELRDWMADNTDTLLLAFSEYDRSASKSLGL